MWGVNSRTEFSLGKITFTVDKETYEFGYMYILVYDYRIKYKKYIVRCKTEMGSKLE